MIVLFVNEDEFSDLESGLDDYGDKEGIAKLRAQLENQNPFRLIQKIIYETTCPTSGDPPNIFESGLLEAIRVICEGRVSRPTPSSSSPLSGLAPLG